MLTASLLPLAAQPSERSPPSAARPKRYLNSSGNRTAERYDYLSA